MGNIDTIDLAYKLRLEVERTLTEAGIEVKSEAANKALGEAQNAFEEVLEETLLDLDVPTA